jgi:hypothetical protein
MIDARNCVQLQLDLILWCFNAYTVVHAAGWGSTKQQWTVLVVTAVYSIFIESLHFMLYYNSLTDTNNKTAWLCVTKQCHLLGSRLCYSLHISGNIVPYPNIQLLCPWLWHYVIYAAKSFMVTLYWRIATSEGSRGCWVLGSQWYMVGWSVVVWCFLTGVTQLLVVLFSQGEGFYYVWGSAIVRCGGWYV